MASETIGALYPTKIPGYADIADIQAAFKLYHYGSLDYDTANTDPNELVASSIAYALQNIQNQINTLDPPGGISKSIIDAKGDLIIGSADNTVARLGVGSNNYVLMADSSQTLGIKWATLPTGSTSTAGILQLTDSVSSTSTTTAATANAVKTAYELAADASTTSIPATLMMMGG